MKNNIAIIDYGVGNIKSIYNAIKFCDNTIEVELVSIPEELKNYSKIILPGVGAFHDAMEKINSTGFNEAIIAESKSGKYLLGICLGMQLLGTCSFEFGKFSGLNIIPGEVHPFDSEKLKLKVPHVGWNSVTHNSENKLFTKIQDQSDFYFVHSFYFKCSDQQFSLAITEYGVDFSSAVKKDNVYGVQFHPEKSQLSGLQMIKNFLLMS